MKLTDRLAALERNNNTAPMLTMEVDGQPTDEQTAIIDRCTKNGRRLIVCSEPGNTAWILGCGLSPWEVAHAKP